LSVGGSISIFNLQIDLSSKRVYADLTGNFSGVANHTIAPVNNTSISTIEHLHLFDYQLTTGPTVLSVGNTSVFTVSGLSITQDGYYHLLSAMRLVLLGTTAWSSISDYGSIKTSITAVPEPSTYGLALTGIAVIAAVKRRRIN
jgi:hypothetical protein